MRMIAYLDSLRVVLGVTNLSGGIKQASPAELTLPDLFSKEFVQELHFCNVRHATACEPAVLTFFSTGYRQS